MPYGRVQKLSQRGLLNEEDQLGRISAPVSAWQRLMREIPTDTGWYYPHLRQTWESNRGAFTPEFVEFMDGLLEQQ